MATQYDENRYLRPKAPTNLFNSAVQLLTRLGVSLWGSRVLYVRGRKSGELRSTPVNLLTFEGERYLVAPRGHTQWVRNLRVAGEAELRVGRRVEMIKPVELSDDEKPPVIHAYLKKWAWETGAFFEDITAKTPQDELRRVAPGFPVFRIPA
ncbi:nitroreductase [Prauserella sp. PE36]|uniref:Nitroreductase family deazaflavin-dependent oxidoreductase n=1 Tax=Prauserella endophytica TaxID=1592324 RepID=A0ABY2RW98_9PSEU|nr:MULTISPECIES: nitroreductase family deazaflavin-dependent oxidoreductase [Prauserella]PXY34419.1 nitroreductase [Prauserella coralliicola]RBM20532.1 nitroreductase [Prauserella sp. PE36]TKG62910.1 nitroreductase family deazaflavin-dependent oxidoreductase [Prauserella endophytica]